MPATSRRRCAFAVLAVVVIASACTLRLQVGDLDAGSSVDPCDTAADCTSAGASCVIDTDCVPGRCNRAVRRCFDPDRSCDGVACGTDRDCGDGEACDGDSGRCVDPEGPEPCRPCDSDLDCDGTTCDDATSTCR